MHPTTRGRPKKQQNSSFDNFSLLLTQQKRSYNEMKFELRACNSDGE